MPISAKEFKFLNKRIHIGVPATTVAIFLYFEMFNSIGELGIAAFRQN